MKKFILFYLLLTSLITYSQTTGVRKITITNPAAITITGTATPTTGFGNNDGHIEDFAISGGTLANGQNYIQLWKKDNDDFTMTNFSQLTAGTYTVLVTDSNSCSATKTFIVYQPDQLKVKITQPDSITCFGGVADLTAKADGGYPYVGKKNYVFTWYKCTTIDGDNPNEITSVASDVYGVTAGFYMVQVTDGQNKTVIAQDIVHLVDNPQISVTKAITNVKCLGDNSGAVTLNIGTGNSITWANSASTSTTRTNLTAGTYPFTVQNSLGCKYTDSVIIKEPTAVLQVPYTLKQPTAANNDGQITFGATTGGIILGENSTYTYKWSKEGDGSFNPGNVNEKLDLGNGTYYILVTSSSGCQFPLFTLKLEALKITKTSQIDVKCYGASTGSLAINASGGTVAGDYDYVWYKNGSEITGQKNNILTGLEAGTYTIKVTDDVLNTVTDTYTIINEPAGPLTVSEGPKQDVSCYNGSDGKRAINVSGGTPGSGYTFLWSNGSTVQNQTNLPFGTYSVTVTDSNGCTQTLSNLNVGQPPAAIAIPQPTITNVAIYGQNTGAITIGAVTGGTPVTDYQYNWTYDKDGAFIKVTKNITGLKAGNYTLTVTDSKLCTQIKTFEVKENPELLVTLGETKSIKCFSDTNGEITAVVSGGVLNYTYQWFKDGNPYPGNTNIISNLGFGKYKVTVTDAVTAAKQSLELNLIQPAKLAVTLTSKVNVLCFGNSTGTINITIAGGTTPYTYQWKKDVASTVYATTEDLTTLQSGSYSVLVTDANLCTVSLNNVVITQPVAALAINEVQVKNLTGFETKNGILEVNITGGTPVYTYAWRVKGNTAVIGTAKLLDQLAIGTYELTVTDQNSCSIVKEYTLTQPNRLDITSILMTANTQVKCFGDKTAELTATITGGVPAYIYKWYNALAPTVILSTTKTVSGLGAGKYIVAVTDQNNNVLYGTNEYTVTQPNPLALTYTKTEVSCKNGSDGTINLNITGGSSAYNIVWNYDSANNNGKANISNLPQGTYTVTVSDKNAVNCSISKTITITEPANALAITTESVTNATGFGLNNGKITVQISGGTPAYSYKWFKNTVEIAGETAAVLNNQLAGSYKLIVTDSKNCSLEKTYTITEPLKLEVNITVAKTIDCFKAAGILRGAAKTGTGVPDAQGFYTYKWYSENNTLINTTLGLNAVTGNIQTGKYYVTVIDANNNQTTSNLFELIQPTQIIVTTTNKQDVTCFDGNDGVVEINVVGGTPDIVAGAPVYTYLWSNGSKDKNQYSLRKGTYSVSVYDGNLCLGTLNNIVIDQPLDFGFDLDKIVPSIPTAGNNDGALHIEIVGGVAPYRYVCRDSNGTIIKDVANSTLKQIDFTNLASSIFTVSATDATGCTKAAEFDFNNNVLEISIAQSATITCNNGQNASITAVVKGGFGIRTISWYKNNVKIPNESNVLLSNLEIGTYYAIVKDFNKVEITSASIVITQPDPIVVKNTQKNVSCLGYNDGAIYLTAAGGSNSFQYRYKTQDSSYGNWILFNNLTAEIPNLKAAIYDIQVQDSKGCNYTSVVNLEITEPKQLLISQKTITPATGFGLSNGSINIVVQGGTTDYNYKWFTSADTSVNETTATASNLAAGKYYAIVTDAKGCSITSDLYEVTQPDLLVVTITKINSVLCNGDQNASLKANVSGGLAGYTYKWFSIPDSGVLGTNVTLGNIGIGTYYVEVTDTKNNISKSDSFVIDQPEVLNNTLTADYTLCGDGNDWTITPAPTGGTEPYNYLWNTGAVAKVLANVPSGTYTLTVTDFNGCAVTKSINFVTPAHLGASEVIKIPTCYQGSDATIVVTTIAGTAPYKYLWNTGETSNVLSNASAGEYTVKITDFRGCTISKTYTIENPPKDVIYLGEDVTLCYEQSLTINAAIDDNQATYSWSSDKGFKSTNPLITISQPATYTVVVTNKLGCLATDSITISSQESAISSEFAMSSQVFVNEKFIIVDISNPKADKIEWKLPPEAVVTTNNGDYAELSFTKAGEYDITLNTNKGQCTAYQTKTILVTEGEYVDPDETDLQKKFDMKIYPNPSNGIFTVDVALDKIMPASIKVYNLSNNVIIDSKNGNGNDTYSFNFNLSGLTSGIYFVLFESQQGTKLRKIIIQ